jgi:hypothetical protein
MAHITPRRWRNPSPGQTLLHGPLTYVALSSRYEPGQPRHSIAENVGKQRRGALHGAGFAIGHEARLWNPTACHRSPFPAPAHGRRPGCSPTTWHSNRARDSSSKSPSKPIFVETRPRWNCRPIAASSQPRPRCGSQDRTREVPLRADRDFAELETVGQGWP